MTTLTCLSLIIFMEGANQSIETKDLLAEFAIEKALDTDRSICQTISDKHTYSWSWNGDLHKRGVKIFKKKNLVTVGKDELEKEAYSISRTIARHALLRQQIRKHTYFNNCTSGKRFKTAYPVLKSEKLCFY
jgi:hypothetical protein